MTFKQFNVNFNYSDFHVINNMFFHYCSLFKSIKKYSDLVVKLFVSSTNRLAGLRPFLPILTKKFKFCPLWSEQYQKQQFTDAFWHFPSKNGQNLKFIWSEFFQILSFLHFPYGKCYTNWQLDQKCEIQFGLKPSICHFLKKRCFKC